MGNEPKNQIEEIAEAVAAVATAVITIITIFIPPPEQCVTL